MRLNRHQLAKGFMMAVEVGTLEQRQLFARLLVERVQQARKRAIRKACKGTL